MDSGHFFDAEFRSPQSLRDPFAVTCGPFRFEFLGLKEPYHSKTNAASFRGKAA